MNYLRMFSSKGRNEGVEGSIEILLTGSRRFDNKLEQHIEDTLMEPKDISTDMMDSMDSCAAGSDRQDNDSNHSQVAATSNFSSKLQQSHHYRP